jgi:hypothetical protein
MNQETLQKAKLLDKNIEDLKQINYVFGKNVRISIEAIEVTKSGSLSPYIINSMNINSIYYSELNELRKKWSSQKLQETEQELELL